MKAIFLSKTYKEHTLINSQMNKARKQLLLHKIQKKNSHKHLLA